MRGPKIVEYILSLEKRGILFGLDNIRSILDLIGNPQDLYKTVHVAGTNGKGSVCKILSLSLTLSGFRTGRYTSPHLHSITERFSVDEKDITYEEFVEIVEYIWSQIEKRLPDVNFSFFDFTTAVAFEFFRRKGIEIGIIEVGLGGRLDSTNVINPLVSVITNVSYDHMDYLGPTLKHIAEEKSGIIKEGIPVVTGAKGIALSIIKRRAKEKGSPIFVLHRDFDFKKVDEKIFDYRGISWKLNDLYVNLEGDHQFVNSAISLACLELLSERGFRVREDSIREALKKVEWMGRLEILKEKPLIVADGAHNVDGMKRLCEYVLRKHRGKNVITIFGVMKDKEFKKMAKLVSIFSDTIILTMPKMDRAQTVDVLKESFRDALKTESVREALILARDISKDDDLILITGSLFVVGEARALIDEIF